MSKDILIELANETTTSDFGSGVNKAVAVTSKNAFMVKEGKASLRTFAARKEATSKAQLDIEKFNKMTVTNGGDLEDDTAPTWTVIDNQALITFDSGYAISVGFKLTPKVVRQARSDPKSFLDRYTKKIGFDLAKKEDIYIGSILVNNAVNIEYAGDATSSATLDTGSIFTVEMLDTMIDDMREREYEPTDFMGTAKVLGQLRRSAHNANSTDYNTIIKANGTKVTMYGEIEVTHIPGVDIFDDYAIATGSGTYGLLVDREGAFGVVDFLKKEGASPVNVYVAQPNPTQYDGNYHKILGQEELQCKYLDTNAAILAKVSKN